MICYDLVFTNSALPCKEKTSSSCFFVSLFLSRTIYCLEIMGIYLDLQSSQCLICMSLIPCMQQYGISPEKFLENMDLCNFFKILTNSADSDNKVLAMSNYLFL